MDHRVPASSARRTVFKAAACRLDQWGQSALEADRPRMGARVDGWWRRYPPRCFSAKPRRGDEPHRDQSDARSLSPVVVAGASACSVKGDRVPSRRGRRRGSLVFPLRMVFKADRNAFEVRSHRVHRQNSLRTKGCQPLFSIFSFIIPLLCHFHTKKGWLKGDSYPVETLAQLLLRLRTERSLTQDHLAQLAYCSIATIANVESGRHSAMRGGRCARRPGPPASSGPRFSSSCSPARSATAGCFWALSNGTAPSTA